MIWNVAGFLDLTLEFKLLSVDYLNEAVWCSCFRSSDLGSLIYFSGGQHVYHAASQGDALKIRSTGKFYDSSECAG